MAFAQAVRSERERLICARPQIGCA